MKKGTGQQFWSTGKHTSATLGNNHKNTKEFTGTKLAGRYMTTAGLKQSGDKLQENWRFQTGSRIRLFE